MAIANYYEQKPLIIFTFKKLCNGEQRLAAQQYFYWVGSSIENCICIYMSKAKKLILLPFLEQVLMSKRFFTKPVMQINGVRNFKKLRK